jgi:RND family efflux transporter MFP subunit
MNQGAKPLIRKRFPWGWAVLGALAVVAAAGTYIQRHAPVSLAVTAPMVFKAGQRDPVVTASGYIVARHRATLSAKVPGRVAWLGVEEGSRVAKGQVIARLENPDVQAQVQRARTVLRQAELDLGRSEALARAGILPAASLDQARTARDQARADLAYQEALLENMVLRAPFTGTVTQKVSEVGETVNPGTAGGTNAINAVAVMADFDSLEVEVEVNETGIPRLKPGMPVEIRIDALDAEPGARPLQGRLRAVYPTSNRQKAVVIVRVAFQEKGPGLLPDMGAKVTFLGEPYRQDTVVLGREQVVRRRGEPMVWVLEGGRAALRPVTVTAENPVGLEVRGLAPDAALLVLPPDLHLEPGARVRVKER